MFIIMIVIALFIVCVGGGGLFLSYQVGLIRQCEDCGGLFLSKDGYTDLMYSHCPKCCDK